MASRPPNSKKGQAIPIDFMAGLFIFMVLLAYFLILWDIFSTRFMENSSRGLDEASAISLAEQLSSFGGQPFNWTDAPLLAQSIGFAARQGYLDKVKISSFSSIPYANAKQLLGTERDFLIKVEGQDGARHYTIGQESDAQNRSIEVTRTAVMDGEVVFVRVQIHG